VKTLQILFLVVLPVLIITGCNDYKYFQWNKIDTNIEDGSICGNGSPYKFFVNPSFLSKNVLIYFEAGGACWDYESCSGQTGIRGAANPNGIPDDYMEGFSTAAIMSPFVFRNHPWDSLPTKTWTIIFIPYCTGDIHTGDSETVIYKDPTGQDPDLEWHHAGYKNVQAVIDWMVNGNRKEDFEEIPTLMVTGCSAGGVGSLINYHFIREGLGKRVAQSILLNDSGPIYPAVDTYSGISPEDLIPLDRLYNDDGSPVIIDGDYRYEHSYENYPHSLPLHRQIGLVWGFDTVTERVKQYGFDPKNYGTINRLLSEMYPDDRLAHTQFTRDGNYSGYSYERFYPYDIDLDRDGLDIIHEYWAEDQSYLMGLYDELNQENNNTGYFIPYFRPFNESHCTCVFDFSGTIITEYDMNVKDFIRELMDFNIPMADLRYYEEPNEDELNRYYPHWDLLNLLMEAI
jgi:hypothetical protein